MGEYRKCHGREWRQNNFKDITGPEHPTSREERIPGTHPPQLSCSRADKNNRDPCAHFSTHLKGMAGMKPCASLNLALCLTLCLAMASVTGWWREAAAQSFFAESEALQPGSEIRFTLSDLNANSSTSSGVGIESSVEESSLRQGTARARFGFVGFGGAVEDREFQEQTETAFQRDDRESTAGYVAMVFEGLLLEDDALLIVASSGARDETFIYETYTRRLTLDTERQVGVVLQMGFLVLGYIEGRDRLTLEVTDPAVAPISEEYGYDFTARIAGLVVGDPLDWGLALIWQRKKTPPVPGTAVNLEEGYEELRRGRIGLGPVALELSETRFSESLSGQSARDTRERDASLGVTVTEVFQLAITQKRIKDEQSFTLAGLPSQSLTDRTENLLTFGFRF